MMRFLVDHLVLIAVFFAIVWFVVKHVVADLPDDVLSQAYKRVKQKKLEEAEHGGVRDNR
ncbi:hypothetical protein GJ697_01440 [Pseudoduganella sp. FT25W]|uniref:CcoQ/FixQ family Cbb3-type cytochrome c oxidase assembly chaperone n=1 Tax=Duganella alba TaxID=2666081 RepID=A0A6L5Q9X0_9BURK|nr:hypothetical protein [Duganella alba]MRX06495.1 hypothetical protein [Duganella alba]MRX14889.1 hypothetical protein [Duganella alba]